MQNMVHATHTSNVTNLCKKKGIILRLWQLTLPTPGSGGDTKTYRAVDYNVFFVLTDMTHIIYSIKHLDIPTKYHAT